MLKSNSAIHPPSFLEATRFWLKLGFISFGGPAGQIATLHQEVVERQRWISEKRFLHALNYCMLLPGPEALQLVTYIGWLMHRSLGGLVAGILFILPSLFLIILLTWLYINFGETAFLSGIFSGIKPAVTAIVLHAAYKIGSRILKTYKHRLIAFASLIAIAVLEVPYPLIIGIAALLGFLIYQYDPYFSSTQEKQTHDSSNESINRDLFWLNDHSPPPEHAQIHHRRTMMIGIVSLLAWALPFVGIFLLDKQPSVLAQMGWFFTKTAMLTFGGAYAVFPYVYQGVVEHFQWISASQMMDGLALGETTPGPLIIIVAFVGYLSAHGQEIVTNNPLLSGIVGALIASWYIFLPSFFFIFIGGPYIESSRSQLKLSGALTGISCAVVGVMVSLAVFFGLHTFWPEGIVKSLSNIDWFSVILCTLASISLIKFKRTIPEILIICAGLGLLWSHFGT